LIGTRQRVIAWERICESWQWFIEQVKYRALDGPARRFRQRLDLRPRRTGESNEATATQ